VDTFLAWWGLSLCASDVAVGAGRTAFSILSELSFIATRVQKNPGHRAWELR